MIHKTFTEEQIQEKIDELDAFQAKHNLALHPGRTDIHNHDEWARRILSYGHCPCDFNRLHCPCPEALGEIAKQGHCHCRHFFDSHHPVYNEYKPKQKS